MSCIYKYKGKDYTKDEFYSLVSNPSFIQQEQEKKFAELQERLNNKEFLEGTKNAFESSEELQQFGTQEQYNDYIARVSLGIIKNPSSGEYNYESKVKDIVYHGTDALRGKSGIDKEGFKKPNRDRLLGGKNQIGIFFTDKENASNFSKDLQVDLAEQAANKFEDTLPDEYKEQLRNTSKPILIPAIINASNPINLTRHELQKQWENLPDKVNSVLVTDLSGKYGYEKVVFEPEQIHILSSKADIEGFKEFIQEEKDDLKPFIDESNKIGEQIRDVENIQETKPNKQLDLFDNNAYYQLPKSREKEEYVASEKTIRDLAARMSDRIGIPVKFESDRTKEYKGKLEKGTAVINLAYATLDTPIHEILGHPIIRAIKYSKSVGGTITLKGLDTSTKKQELSQLYQNLLKELEYGKGKEVLDRIKRDYNKKFNGEWYVSGYGEHSFKKDGTIDGFKPYNNEQGKYKIVVQGKVLEFNNRQEALNYVYYTPEEQQEEAIVELMSLMVADKLDKVKDGKLISLLKRLLKEMKQFIRSLINQKEVEIDKLPDNMTLGDIADLLAYSNSKLILPGYEVEYTTPDGIKHSTYQEASNHISKLFNESKDIDLSDVNLNKQLTKKELTEIKELEEEIKDTNEKLLRLQKEKLSNYDYEKNIQVVKEKLKESYSRVDYSDDYEKENTIYNLEVQLYNLEQDSTRNLQEEINNLINEKEIILKNIDYIKNYNPLNNFIEKNKEYEQSKEIIEEWKKVNNIVYNPEEIYSRGQEFSSVVGAYSNFDVNLMMQNLLSHIEDNEKAGGKFAISAYTKPIDKQIGHLEGGGGKIKFKLYPQSNDILWAANTDVYSGSVWDASEKVNKDKKSELLGVSYTKYPSLSNVNTVQPNLASIVDDLNHHHNELAISLNFSNFEIEVDEDVPYQTKKIIENVNKILQQKRLEQINNFINKLEKEC